MHMHKPGCTRTAHTFPQTIRGFCKQNIFESDANKPKFRKSYWEVKELFVLRSLVWTVPSLLTDLSLANAYVVTQLSLWPCFPGAYTVNEMDSFSPPPHPRTFPQIVTAICQKLYVIGEGSFTTVVTLSKILAWSKVEVSWEEKRSFLFPTNTNSAQRPQICYYCVSVVIATKHVICSWSSEWPIL